MVEKIFDLSLGAIMLCTGVTLLLETVYGIIKLITVVVGMREEIAFLVN